MVSCLYLLLLMFLSPLMFSCEIVLIVDLAVVANVEWSDQLLEQSEWYVNKQSKASLLQTQVKSSWALLLRQGNHKPDTTPHTIKASFKYLLTIFLPIIIGHYGNKWPASFSQNYLMVYAICKLEKINKLVLLIPLI